MQLDVPAAAPSAPARIIRNKKEIATASGVIPLGRRGGYPRLFSMSVTKYLFPAAGEPATEAAASLRAIDRGQKPQRVFVRCYAAIDDRPGQKQLRLNLAQVIDFTGHMRLGGGNLRSNGELLAIHVG